MHTDISAAFHLPKKTPHSCLNDNRKPKDMSSRDEPCIGYNFLRDLCLSSWKLITAARQKIGMLLSIITLLLSACTVFGMAFDRDLRPLENYNKECE